MGRYYNGDIEGKFWFAVQSSDDADFFGSEGVEPNYLEYYFEKEHIDDIQAGIAKCLEKLGDDKEKLDKFFEKNNGYTKDMLDEIGVDFKLLEWYARLGLGEKILKCVKETGQCYFTAER